MSYTSTKPNHNHGTVKSSAENQNCRKNIKKDSGKQKISKFFTKTQDIKLSDSPYKTCLTQIKSAKLENSSSDLDAFKTPKAINKISKISSKPPTKTTKYKKTKQIPLTKFIEDNLKQSDVNPEHLQIALALSESSYEAENPTESLSSQSKRESFKTAFEKFGLGYSKNQISVTNKKPANPTKNKKSRYRFVTPILKIRTQEEREDLIQAKISLILAQNNRKPPSSYTRSPPTFISQHLQELSSQKLYSLNNFELLELNSSDHFYVPKLGIERSSASCGCLLKDWRKIPGCEDETTNQNSKSDETLPTEGDNFKESNLITASSHLDPPSHIETTPNAQINQNSVSHELNSPNLAIGGNNDSNLVLGNPPEIIDLDSSDSEDKPVSLPIVNTNSPNFENCTPPKYILSPDQITPNSGCKRPYSCISPDLFESDDEPSLKVTLVVDRVRGGQGLEDMECFDLTQSDCDENSSQIEISRLEENSDLNVTDYVKNLLTQEMNSRDSPKKLEKISTSEDESQDSQNVIYISDDELNYSSVFSSPFISKSVDSCPVDGGNSTKQSSSSKYNWSDDDFGVEEMSLTDRITRKSLEAPSITQNFNSTKSGLDFPQNASNFTEPPQIHDANSIIVNSPTKCQFSDDEFGLNDLPLAERIRSETKTPPIEINLLENSLNEALRVLPAQETPLRLTQKSLIIKTKNITPMANYDEMDTPKIVKELDKYGLKPLKRPKGAKLLKYIYESTHPIVNENPPKFEESIIGNLDDEIGDVILERKQSKRVASCPVPLHIVWYNFVMSNPKIRENLLLYEPLQLEVLHSMLREQGFKFNIQDLLSFLDKKCITIRTAQGQHHKEKKT